MPPYMRRTKVMGVINLTPDSFSGDGLFRQPHVAARRAKQLVAEGADVIDIGGESTRPGFRPVSQAEELARVISTLREIRSHVAIPISIDTSKAEVARQALQVGAAMVNDISGLADPDMAAVVASCGAWIVLVHSRPTVPENDLIAKILADLRRQIAVCLQAGISPAKIIVDPGLGFAKDWKQNFEILRRLRELSALDTPILVGPSRKGMIGRVLADQAVDRLDGTIALTSIAVANSAEYVRVHDVRAMIDVVCMLDAIAGASL